jgi:hypothetical protein
LTEAAWVALLTAAEQDVAELPGTKRHLQVDLATNEYVANALLRVPTQREPAARRLP